MAVWKNWRWENLGNGLNDRVIALTSDGSDLVAGGAFNEIDGAPANYVARWDGVEWLPFGNGPSGQVYSVGFHDGELYAGGIILSGNAPC